MGCILVVDDDRRLSVLVSRFLQDKGFEVDVAPNGQELFRLLRSKIYDLLILDVNLPGDNGLLLCGQLRSQGNTIPIIMLTARGQDGDRIFGLEKGADDYMVKPFNPQELLARIRAVLRRQYTQSWDPTRGWEGTYQFSDYEFDVSKQYLKKGSEIVELSTGEANLLRVFMMEPGRPLSRSQLAHKMTSREYQPDQRSIDMLISRLRKRLDCTEASGESMIGTLRGIGYMFTLVVKKV